jgi:hypothetical protein
MNEVTTISLDLAKTAFCLFGLISRLCASHWTTVYSAKTVEIFTAYPVRRALASPGSVSRVMTGCRPAGSKTRDHTRDSTFTAQERL